MQDVDRSSFERIEYVRRLRPAGAALANPGAKPHRAHIIGVCGTGMAAVLQLLKHYGFNVSGSDKAFYPPMGDVVRKAADRIFQGYAAENIEPGLDLVVIGNSVSRDNPEVEAAFKAGLPYASMPEVFAALLIGDKLNCATSIVAAGTHGKTTTTTAAAFLLDSAGLKPGYFIGGAPVDLPSGIRPVDETIASAKRCVVLEGDEYDSAFFAKWPKFHSYRPDIVIVTSLEFDHGDIYRSVEEIEEEFTKLLRRIPAGGTALVCDAWPRLIALAQAWKTDPQIKAAVVMFGFEIDSPYRIKLRAAINDLAAQSVDFHPDRPAKQITPGQQLVLELNGSECRTVTPMTGSHNALNICAAAAAAVIAGISAGQAADGIARFHGVLRRQTVRFDRHGVTVIEDFAHHPTAIQLTLRALRESYPDRRIVAVYEPRSATGRRGYFQDEYPESFSSADRVVIQEVADAGRYSGSGDAIVALDVKRIVAELKARGKDALSSDSAAAIEAGLLADTKPGDLIVIMSNGDFGGLVPRLVEQLTKGLPSV